MQTTKQLKTSLKQGLGYLGLEHLQDIIQRCNTLVLKIRLESSYVCPRSPHIQQKNRNIRNNVIYSIKHIYNNTYNYQSTQEQLVNFLGSILLRDG